MRSKGNYSSSIFSQDETFLFSNNPYRLHINNTHSSNATHQPPPPAGFWQSDSNEWWIDNELINQCNQIPLSVYFNDSNMFVPTGAEYQPHVAPHFGINGGMRPVSPSTSSQPGLSLRTAAFEHSESSGILDAHAGDVPKAQPPSLMEAHSTESPSSSCQYCGKIFKRRCDLRYAPCSYNSRLC